MHQRTKTILVFDRQAVSRRLLRFSLELQGYQVIEAGASPVDVGALWSGQRPDLLVIGVDPTDGGDHELLAGLRRRPELADLPVLIVGERSCRDLLEPRMTGNCAWLDKPFRMKDLNLLAGGLLEKGLFPADDGSRQVQ